MLDDDAPAQTDSPAAELDRLRRELEGLQIALATRGPIEQAKGIVMAHLGCDDEEAFRHLVRVSQHRNEKVHDIALSVTELAARAQLDDLRGWLDTHVGPRPQG